MNRREFLEHSKKGTLAAAAGLTALHATETAGAASKDKDVTDKGAAKPKYRSLVGYPQGAKKIHVHETEFATGRGAIST